MASQQPDVDSGSLPAVKSLRSRFEQLANETFPTTTKRAPNSRNLLSPDRPGSPRPRAASGSNVFPPDAHQLRSTSSSSDLKGGARRPPPPPPRGINSGVPSPGQSPTASPLLRPVPIPPSSASMSSLSLYTPISGKPIPVPKVSVPPSFQVDSEALDIPPSGGVASLRNKFK